MNLFCPNCGMINCVCGYNNKSAKSKNNKPKVNKKVKVKSPPKVSLSNKKPKKEKNSPKSVPSPSSNTYEKILSDISNSIEKGYKYIVLESNYGNSDIAVKLANNFKNSIILTANEKSEMRYNKEYQLKNNSRIHLTNQIKLFDEYEKIEKSDLLIIDDAHRLDENIVNLFSYYPCI